MMKEFFRAEELFSCCKSSGRWWVEAQNVSGV